MAEEAAGPERDVQWATTAMLKAYAHPLRRRMAKLLAARGHGRAADIAAALEVPANSISFHLRALADAGLIEEAPELARDRRDRVWRPVQASWNVGSPEHPVVDEELGNALMAALVEDHIDMVRRVVAWSSEYVSGRDPVPHGHFSQRNTRLTPEEYLTLTKRIDEVFREVEAGHDPDGPDSRPWTFDIIAADDTICPVGTRSARPARERPDRADAPPAGPIAEYAVRAAPTV